MLKLAYRPADQRAVLSWDEADAGAPWLPLLQDMVVHATEDALGEGGAAISLPWWSFVGLRNQFGDLLQAFGLRVGQELQIEAPAVDLLRQSARNAQSYTDAIAGEQVTEDGLLDRLRAEGFARPLKAHQVRNIRRLAALPAAATFSVPGAGKTTEALATFAYRRQPGDRLLVIAPKNAFAAWDEQLK